MACCVYVRGGATALPQHVITYAAGSMADAKDGLPGRQAFSVALVGPT